jgi:fermentation-respiration switch protein FrsA (DUF1100 family)
MSEKAKKRVYFYLSLYVIVGLLLYSFQSELIYFPTPKMFSNHKSIVIKNDNCEIDVTLLNSNIKTDKAIIYFGGNAENVILTAEDFKTHFKKQAVFLLSYRGYGDSTGEPNQKANYSDALKLYDLVKREYDSIIVIGRSLGSGVATYLASKREVDSLILITPYDSIESIAQSKFPIYPISILLHEKYLSIENVKNINAKCLAIIAEKDEVIPFENSKRLLETFPKEQISIKIIKDVSHNNISSSKEYYQLMSEFIENN